MNLSDEIDLPESGAHTLSKHVDRSPAGAVEDAQENLRKGLAPISTLWTNAGIAQQAVDRVLAQYFFPNGKKNAARQATLDNFLTKRKQWADKTELVITGKWDKYESLGTVYKASGPPAGRGERSACGPEEASGQERHEGFIVFDSYPLSK
ncbi:hypothetical protein [Streptomyces mirabilis]|uniref:hypothetical protein n=1 Tax=Streptomyces mirabilis TaxID=68239 RepID=UPI0036C3E1DC